MTIEELTSAIRRLTRRIDVDDVDSTEVVYEVDDNGNVAPIIDVELRDGKLVLK